MLAANVTNCNQCRPMKTDGFYEISFSKHETYQFTLVFISFHRTHWQVVGAIGSLQTTHLFDTRESYLKMSLFWDNNTLLNKHY